MTGQIRFNQRAALNEPASSETIPQLNLLAHAQILELEIGSRCGGFGECGGDRVRITEGAELLSPVTAAEREHLSADEIRAGCRLACQAFPQRADARINVETRGD